MSVLSAVERKALFSLTRFLALLMTLLLALGVAWAAYVAFVGTVKVPAVGVKAEAVSAALAMGGSVSPDEDADPLKKLTIPENGLLKQWLSSPQAKAIIEKKVREVSVKERQRFMDELGKVAAMAQKDQKPPADYVTSFFIMWEASETAAKTAVAAKAAERQQAIYAVGAGLALIALFSLVLVLLAIERNTRAAEA